MEFDCLFTIDGRKFSARWDGHRWSVHEWVDGKWYDTHSLSESARRAILAKFGLPVTACVLPLSEVFHVSPAELQKFRETYGKTCGREASVVTGDITGIAADLAA
ncbi:MAG: hypothetical protein KGI41_00425 [Patescibacteria group bacterium]|nr:hypothetical protein [Patescibacteria group bacterium]MDE1965695.1 hypothetical protein [Patescibacteria group bacterium]